LKKNFTLIGSLLGLLLVAGIAIIWAMKLMDSAQGYRSPLANTPPQPGEVLGTSLTRRVVVILVDALRYDTSSNAAVMPQLNALRSEGASAVMHSQPPSFSAPGYATILTGAWPEINDSQIFNPPDDDNVWVFTQDNIFSAAHRAGLKTAVSGYIWFKKMLADSNVSMGFYTPGYDEAADIDVEAAVMPWLSQDYQLIFIHLDQVDYAGHYQGGPRDPRWDAAATRADTMIGEIVSHLDLTQDTVLVISDHGQIARGGHGGPEAVTLVEPFVLAGAGVLPGEFGNVTMADVAPTLAAILGTSIPASSEGQVLVDMLNLSPAQIAGINTATRSQEKALFSAYANAIGASSDKNIETFTDFQNAMQQIRESKLIGGLIWRSLLALFLIVFLGVILFRNRGKEFIWIISGAILDIILFNLVYVFIGGKTYSTSSFNEGATFLIIFNASLAAGALMVAWLFTMLASKAFRKGSGFSVGIVLKLLWSVLFLLSIPIFVSFAINGFVVTWSLPEWHTLFLGLLSLIQTLITGVLGLLLVGVSGLVAKLVHKRV
jgi:hypothetical protein